MGGADSEVAVQVAGLADGVSDAVLMNVFRPYGAVLRVKRDAYNGAHVIFNAKHAATKAIKATNGAVVEGKAISVKLVPQFKKTSRPCRGFQAGICRKGDACKYYHMTPEEAAAPTELTAPPKIKTAAPTTIAAAAPAAAPAIVTTDVSNIPSSVVCRHFARGFCSLGATCKFAHVVGSSNPTPAVNPAAVVKTRPCAYFASGVCTRGDQCTFLHVKPVVAPVAAEPAAVSATTKKTLAKKTAAAPSKKQQQLSESESESNEEDGEQEAQNDDRTCIECEESGVARWKCANCDNALYCDACDAAAHRAKVMAKHKRSLLPPPAEKKPTCGECEEAAADVKCEQCEVDYCSSCDASVHKFKSLRTHVRTTIGSAIGAQKEPDKAEKKKKEKKEKKKVAKAVAEEEKSVASATASALAVTPSWSAKAEARQFVESVPKYELSSDSDSDDDDDDNDDSDDEEEEESAVVSSSASAPSRSVVAAAKKPAPTQPVEISSESSEDEEDEEEDEKPAPMPKPVPAAASNVNNDEDSSSESDFDDVRPAHTTAAKTKAEVPAAPAAASSSSSSSSSETETEDSDDDEKPAAAPAAPAARPAAKKPLPTPPANRKPGISTGSSHTLVKKIEEYYESESNEAMHLDANLNGFERLLAHDCAERLGLEHVSVGEGLERHITISKPGSQSAGSKRAGEPTSSGAKRRKTNK